MPLRVTTELRYVVPPAVLAKRIMSIRAIGDEVARKRGSSLNRNN